MTPILLVHKHLLEWKQTEMDKPNLRNDYESFHQFLNSFCEKLIEKCENIETVPIRQPNPRIRHDEIEGETLEWCLNFLSTRGCPQVLAALLAREVYVRVSDSDLDQYLTDDSRNSSRRQLEEKEVGESIDTQVDQKTEDSVSEYSAEKLHSYVVSTLENVCKSWQTSLPDHPLPNRILEVSEHAIKNTRRKMEDSHVIIPDLNSLYRLKDSPSQSFYGVFDGHAGTEASMFSSKHIHSNLVHKCPLDKLAGQALKSAFKATDDHFFLKAKRERWKSGTTGVAALVRGNQLHMAWLGDSQGVLVRDGKVAAKMEPHKPERQDERDRIEAEGGFTMLVGDCWRVGGNIAVSRAIGDIAYKPFISSEAEVISQELDGTEDYLVLACDGLWDVVTEDELPRLVYNYIVESGGDRSSVAKYLVQYAKDQDSLDNISVIVVFFRDSISEPKAETGLFDFQFGDSQGDNNMDNCDSKGKGDYSDIKKGNSDNQCGKGDNQGSLEKPSDDMEKSGREKQEGYSDMYSFQLHPNGDETGPYDSEEEDYFDIKENSTEFPHTNAQVNRFIDIPDASLAEDEDLDYYGVFNTRLVDGPIDLSFMDDPNSSLLLKNIAESVYGRRHGEDAPRQALLAFDKLLFGGHADRKHADIPVIDKQNMKKNQPRLKQQPLSRKYNKKGSNQSPVCWAFTGKNKASVQNHKLNRAARVMNKGFHLTPGEVILANKGPPVVQDKRTKPAQFLTMDNSNYAPLKVKAAGLTLQHGKLDKLDSLQPLPRAKALPQAQGMPATTSSNFTVFGSKSHIQPEVKKFHTSWRPRKPLKPISSIVYETPPTPFMQQKVANFMGHKEI